MDACTGTVQTGRKLLARPITLPSLRRKHVWVMLAVCGVLLAVAGVVALVREGQRSEARYHSGVLEIVHDRYHYLVYVPSSYRSAVKPVPLLVVLHGCTMTAEQQAIASGYAPIAEKRRLIVLYPDVDAVDQAYGRCWKAIWNPAGESRHRGDAAAIAAMTAAVIHAWRIDPARVYVIGISAGAYESSVLGATYPDVFAAIGIHSGAAYAGGQPGCLTVDESPASTMTVAHAALATMGSRARVMPVIVFHGDQDHVIPYRCGQQALHQWLETDNLILKRDRLQPLPATPTSVERTTTHRRHYTVASFANRQQCTVAQLWTIHGMGHAWSGGSNDPSVARYTYPDGPSASAASTSFFLHWSLTSPPGQCIAPK